MKPSFFIISVLWALFLSCVLLAVSLAAAFIIIELLRAVSGTHLIFTHHDKNEAPVFLIYLGLCAFPYSFVYIPIAMLSMAVETMQAHQAHFLKAWYARCRRRIIWRTAIGIILWILLFVTGAYIA